MIMVGFLARLCITLILSSCMASILIQMNPSEEWSVESLILRWGCYFLIAYVVRTLLEKNQKEEENLLTLITLVSKSIDARDNYTSFHSQNVAYYSREIGRALKLSCRECDHLYIGGLLHDFGKIGIPEEILNKPSPLTNEEYIIIQKHPVIGYDMLKQVSYFKENCILDMVLHHHEKYDGSGYPYGLQGEEIPLVARIMAVADAFDAMTSNRVYRNQKNIDFAINQISKGKGNQFDPNVAETFLQLIKKQDMVLSKNPQ